MYLAQATTYSTSRNQCERDTLLKNALQIVRDVIMDQEHASVRVSLSPIHFI